MVTLGIGNENILRKTADGSGALRIVFCVAGIRIHSFADRKVGHIFADLHHARHSFVSKFPADSDLVARVRTVGENRYIRTANTGIEVLHQHVLVSDLRQRQLPQFNMFFS